MNHRNLFSYLGGLNSICFGIRARATVAGHISFPTGFVRNRIAKCLPRVPDQSVSGYPFLVN